MAGFQPVPGHVGFLAKGVFGQADRVLDVSIARLEPGGGGPEPPHRHPERDHLFIVTERGCPRVCAALARTRPCWCEGRSSTRSGTPGVRLPLWWGSPCGPGRLIESTQLRRRKKETGELSPVQDGCDTADLNIVMRAVIRDG